MHLSAVESGTTFRKFVKSSGGASLCNCSCTYKANKSKIFFLLHSSYVLYLNLSSLCFFFGFAKSLFFFSIVDQFFHFHYLRLFFRMILLKSAFLCYVVKQSDCTSYFILTQLDFITVFIKMKWIFRCPTVITRVKIAECEYYGKTIYRIVSDGLY